MTDDPAASQRPAPGSMSARQGVALAACVLLIGILHPGLSGDAAQPTAGESSAAVTSSGA